MAGGRGSQDHGTRPDVEAWPGEHDLRDDARGAEAWPGERDSRGRAERDASESTGGGDLSDAFAWDGPEGAFDDEFGEEAHADGAPVGRRPLWVTASVIVNVLIFVALLPFMMVLLFPPFAVYFVELARIIVWISPLLLVGDALALAWGFPRKRPVVTGFSLLGLVFVAVSFAITLYAAGGQPVTVLGIPFGGADDGAGAGMDPAT
ncbi:hypothetical protein GCM10009595_14780 [Falsarthrobacter nasiphocae]